MTNDECLSAYLDGELDADDRADLELRLTTDAALRTRLESLRVADLQLRKEIGEADALPMPASILRQLDAQAAPRIALPTPANDTGTRWWARAAAAIALIVTGGVAGHLMTGTAPTGDSSSSDATLVVAIETLPSGRSVALGTNGSVTMRASFPGTDPGQWCRQFDIDLRQSRRAGVACNGHSGWQIKGLVPRSVIDPTSNNAYTVAEGGADPQVDAIIAESRGGDPIAPAEEARLIGQHWQAK